MTWVVLALAIVIEVLATAALPRTDGFRNLTWTTFVMGGYVLSIWLLALVVRTMSVSVAYAVWSGLGTALVALIGVVVLGESFSVIKGLFLAMIVVGVVGLNLSGAH